MLSLTVAIFLLSQGWLPQEGSVRRLLCSDPSCPICNAMALEIQQLLGYENKETCLTSLRPSQNFSSLEALASSKVLFDKNSELCSQNSRDISLASSLTPSQSTDQKSAPSTGDANLRCYHADHRQKQEPQGSNVSQGAGSLSSSSVEEPGVPANQQKKKKTTKLVLKSEGQQPLSIRFLLCPGTHCSLNLKQYPMIPYSCHLLFVCPKGGKVPVSIGRHKCMHSHIELSPVLWRSSWGHL